MIMASPLSRVSAAELVYVFDSGCAYCRQWDQEIGPIYGKTAEGRRAPLRRIGKRDPALASLHLKRPILYTPTFVLTEGMTELGRIEGYPGQNFFWSLLETLLKSLPDTEGHTTRPADTTGGAISPRGSPSRD
jgi:hypothetical protein